MRPLMTAFLAVHAALSVGDCSHAQTNDPAWLKNQVEELRKTHNLVGIGATLLVDGKIVASVVSGERKLNSGIELSVADKWHIGSITKSMTATVIGRLVEQNKLAWDSTIPELLPEISKNMHPGWHEVELRHLLTHTAGLPANFPPSTQFIRPKSPDTLRAARRQELSKILAAPPESEPGKVKKYSNVGYTLAGFMAAERAGTTWEELMAKELFLPLGLDSAGFGPPSGDEPLDQPWGHKRLLLFRTPMDPAVIADNTPIMGPAGTVHMSISDLARYGWVHLQGEKSDSAYLQTPTFKRLHQRVIGDYAYGWIDAHDKWADGRVLWHNGSNTYWYALLMIVPSRNAVAVIVTNDGYLKQVQPEFHKLARSMIIDSHSEN